MPRKQLSSVRAEPSSIPHSLYLFRVKSYIFIFLWCFVNSRMFGISPLAGSPGNWGLACTTSSPYWSQRLTRSQRGPHHQSTSAFISFGFEILFCLGGTNSSVYGEMLGKPLLSCTWGFSWVCILPYYVLASLYHFSFLLIRGWLSVCVLGSCFFEDPQGEISLAS